MQASYKFPLLIYIIGILSVWGGVKLLPNYIIRNNTSSEPTGLYFVKTPVDIEVGKRYTIKIPLLALSKRLGLEPNVNSLLKTVVAKNGDLLQVTKDGI